MTVKLNLELPEPSAEDRVIEHLIAATDAMKDIADAHNIPQSNRAIFDALRASADLIHQAALVAASGAPLSETEFKDLYKWAVGKMIEVEWLLPSEFRVAALQWEKALATPRLVRNLSAKGRLRPKVASD